MRNNQKKIKAHLTIASINIKGRGADNISHTGHKWREIYSIMMSKKIAILGVQETHLSSNQVDQINQSWIGKKISVLNTIDPEHPNAAGTAIALNRDLVNTQMVDTYYIIPGRALCITIPWSKDNTLTVLVTYAPNDSMASNKEFWASLTDKWLSLKLPIPDVFMGDHNIVEEGFDRTTGKADNYDATEAFVTFKSLFQMRDGWRRYNPEVREFTHTHWGMNGSATMSRLDRIYLHEKLIKYSREWDISDELGTTTDHRLVQATLMTPELPYQGPGRYAIKPYILENPELISHLMELCTAAASEIEKCKVAQHRSELYNPQVIYEQLKIDIVKKERAFSKQFVGIARAKIKVLKTEKMELLKGLNKNNEEKATKAAKIQ
ncbi:Endonuclease/exonuclease/phosphatase, partial [Lentinula raphanica]